MTADQIAIFLILFASLLLFAWGRLRYDLVALIAMIATVALGLVPADEALSGFGHPAVITVAAVLVISAALRASGFVDMIAARLMPLTATPTLHIGALTATVAVLSAFMNNVGALAVMLPVAMATAGESDCPPAKILMPLAFGSILGGMTTLIGTPPNVIIATYRADVTGVPFGMFDFSPVGAAVAVAGVLFVTFVGWRLIPRQRRGSTGRAKLFEIGDYLIELRVCEGSPLIGQRIAALESLTGDAVVPVGLVRGTSRVLHPAPWHLLEQDDVLVVRAFPEAIDEILESQRLEIVTGEVDASELQSDNVTLVEAVVAPHSPLVGRRPRFLHLRTGHGLTLLAVSRQGAALKTRVGDILFKPGDVLLLQAERRDLAERLADMGLLPLPERGLTLGAPRKVGIALAVFAGALGANLLGLVPLAFAFLGAIVLYVVLNVLPLRDLYRDIDWPVIVLLGAMFSVGKALELTGGAALIARELVDATLGLPPVAVLAIILVITMFVSDLVNNAATALLMAPIAVSVAERLGVSVDPFLMAVAVGASAAFLTPIGHQSNTLVMGPGGYRFGDYWRMGLPLEVLITAIAVPLIVTVWPL
ncbi:MAG: SLC13 family permease [Alphaproteobacteria bacterium]|nr:MAG: SLC13 family permease [Alphaproteobacteria bacterium]